MSDAIGYSDRQMLEAVVRAAESWKLRVDQAERGEYLDHPDAKTAIVVLDFCEIAVLRDAVARRAGYAISPEQRAIAEALEDDFASWLTVSGPTEPPEGVDQ